jgi:hypothetical protein
MNYKGHAIKLTTDHAASSYGIPVLVIDGEAYGPADETPMELAGRSSGLGIVRYLVEEGIISFEESKAFGDVNTASQ